MGGEHGTISHLQAALTRTMNTLGRKTKTLKDGEANLGGDHIREGLTAIISVKVPEPEFEGQTKTRLGNPEVRKILDSVLAKVGRPTPICARLWRNSRTLDVTVACPGLHTNHGAKHAKGLKLCSGRLMSRDLHPS